MVPYIYTHIYIYIFIHVYIYIYVYTRTQKCPCKDGWRKGAVHTYMYLSGIHTHVSSLRACKVQGTGFWIESFSEEGHLYIGTTQRCWGT